jgi:hypothetical protein
MEVIEKENAPFEFKVHMFSKATEEESAKEEEVV